jgi:hypothetical protein
MKACSITLLSALSPRLLSSKRPYHPTLEQISCAQIIGSLPYPCGYARAAEAAIHTDLDAMIPFNSTHISFLLASHYTHGISETLSAVAAVAQATWIFRRHDRLSRHWVMRLSFTEVNWVVQPCCVRNSN